MLPSISNIRLRWFTRYVGSYLHRNFHGLHLARFATTDLYFGHPLLVCLNHPSWWDPLIGLYLSQRLFPDRVHFSPIAAVGLEKYRFFEKLGFFGIDPKTRSGAERFLQFGTATLARTDGAFWVTPQGHFSDVRQRPVILQTGVGHLARRTQNVAMLPVALEYTFWNERYPEAFVGLGEPLLIEDGRAQSAAAWARSFSTALEHTQDRLSSLIIRRDPSAFEPLLEGASGVGGFYDVWRAVKSRIRGKPFAPEHGRT